MRTIAANVLVVILMSSVVTAFALDKQEPQKTAPQGMTSVMIEPAFTVNKGRTAVLVMDYQNDIVSMLQENVRTQLLERTAAVIREARKTNIPVIYVVVRFREGYPEISSRNKIFRDLKGTGWLREGTPGAEIDPKVAPLPGEVVVTKRRVGAFSTTDLETVLRSKSITTIVLCGIATSGVVLSTVRWAADMDYSIVVVSDACADRDRDVHQLLMDRIFPRQATVVTSAELLKAMGAKEGK